jgi:hypothetical protein
MRRIKGPYTAPNPALKASYFINIKQWVHIDTTIFCDVKPYSLAPGTFLPVYAAAILIAP